MDLVNLLLEAKADSNVIWKKNNETALTLTTGHHAHDCIKSLIKAGANVYVCSNKPLKILKSHAEDLLDTIKNFNPTWLDSFVGLPHFYMKICLLQNK